MALTPEEVRAVGHLARLALSDEETARFTHQINDLLEQFARLQELDVEGVEPMSHAVPVAAVLREDEVRPSLPREEVLALQREKYVDQWMGGFKVPQVIGDSQ